MIYLMFVLAVGIGWWLGRGQVGSGGGREGSVNRRLFSSGQEKAQDGAIASFINSLEVNNETLETHLALASLLRRRGEVDKAVTVHENLLSRTQLNRAVLLEVKLELATDYLRAGLLDKAEVLLQELRREDGEVRHQALEYLTEIYALEKEWQEAIDSVSQLRGESRRDGYACLRLAHFHCELAEQALHKEELDQARNRVSLAIDVHPGCVRASLLRGNIEYTAANPEAAARALQDISRQDIRYVPMSLDLLEKCYTSDRLDRKELRQYLKHCLDQRHAVSVLLTLSRIEQEQHGKEAATRYLVDELKDHATLRGLRELIDMHIDRTHGPARENLSVLRGFTERLLHDKPSFRCGECGFATKQIRWCCPSCRRWGSLEPIYGVEGE